MCGRQLSGPLSHITLLTPLLLAAPLLSLLRAHAHATTNRPNVVCTPHLGASTTEAQEGVSTEVAEAVIDALQGKLAATAVNAPMVSAEVLKELAPFVTLAEALGKVGVGVGVLGGG